MEDLQPPLSADALRARIVRTLSARLHVTLILTGCFATGLVVTKLLLMAGVMGIDGSIYESAMLDGASSHTVFWKITMPLLRPIFIYVVITSMIGGIQLFDVAQIFTQTSGGPQQSSETLMMYLYSLISLKQNYGQAGALSV